MTGATYFTRRAGAAGLLALAVSPVVLFASMATFAGVFGGVAVAVLVLGLAVTVVCALVSYAGLLLRHRGESWVRPVVVLTAASVVLAIAGRRAEADGVADAAGVVLAFGLLSAREMPRKACAALLAGALGSLLLTGEAALLAAVPSLVGIAHVSWTMWREPLPGESPAWEEGERIPARV